MSEQVEGKEVHLYKSDDLRKIAELKQARDVAIRKRAASKENSTAKVGGDSSVEDAAAALRDAVEDAATRAETVVIGHIGQTRWRALLAEHRPRIVRRMVDSELQDVMDDEDGEPFFVNTATFPDALLTYVDPSDPEIRTILQPVFATPADRTKWVERLRGGDYDRLWATAYFENGQQSIDPKALLASLESSPDLNAISG